MQPNQVMTSLKLDQLLMKFNEKRYLSQFTSKIFESLRSDSARCASQYELNNTIVMETYWFSDLPDIKYFFVQISYFECLIKWNLKKIDF